jgi:hypothetical protein
MSARRSYRTARRRIWFRWANVRSTTQRCRPSRALECTPRRAIRARMPRARSARRACGKSYALVGVQLGGPALRTAHPAPHRAHGVDQLREDGDLVAVRRGEELGERDPLAVGDDVALGARARSVRRVGPGRLLGDGPPSPARWRRPPPRDPSRGTAPFSRASSTCWRRSHTPAWCQSRSRRQQVIPDPQPISCGSHSH